MKALCMALLLLASGLTALGAPPASAPGTSPAPAADGTRPGVSHSAPAPQPPTLPQLRELLGPAFVTVSCTACPQEHPPGQYGVPGPASCVLGAVSGNEAQGYRMTVTLLREAYAEAFGTDTRTPHTPSPKQAHQTLTLVYDAALGRWALSDSAGGAAFFAVCREHGCDGAEPLCAPAERALSAAEVSSLPWDTGDPGTLILTGFCLLAAAAAAAYLGRRRKGPSD